MNEVYLLVVVGSAQQHEACESFITYGVTESEMKQIVANLFYKLETKEVIPISEELVYLCPTNKILSKNDIDRMVSKWIKLEQKRTKLEAEMKQIENYQTRIYDYVHTIIGEELPTR
jgi:hypothetical protein